MTLEAIRGVYAATLTPLDADGALLPELLVSHCRRLLEAGCHGVAPLGTTGEATSLALRDRLAAVEAVAEALPGDRVIIGTGSCSVGDAALVTRRALAGGLCNVLVLPPFYYKNVTDDGLFAFYSQFIERVGNSALRLFVYNFPQQVGLSVSLRLIARLCESFPSTVAGVKDSSGDPDYLGSLCRDFPSIRILTGMEGLLGPCMTAGGAGCISALANVVAPLCRAVFDNPHGTFAEQKKLASLQKLLGCHPPVPTLKMLVARCTRDRSWRSMLPPNLPLGHSEARAALAAFAAICDSSDYRIPS